MSESPSPGHRNVTLHLWPPYDDLLSFDIPSVAALLYLQLTIPDHFTLTYCTNPDLSPTGQLPFLTHGLHHVSGLGSIIAYVRNLHNAHHLDDKLSALQLAQLTARIAHIEAAYGDLIKHMLYSLQENWTKVTRPILVSMLPLPQRYYVPSRIRASYKTRLEAAELWHVPEDEDEDGFEEPRKVFGRRKKQRSDTEPHRFKTALEREKVVEKTRAVLDVYSRFLGGDRFFMGSQSPTTLDIVFAAHTHILLNLHFPDPLVTTVLHNFYPVFIAHSKAVISTALPNPEYLPPTVHNHVSPLRYIIPWPHPSARRRASSVLAQSPEVQKEEWRYRFWRWAFIGTSILAATAYLHSATIVVERYPDIRPRLPPPAEVPEQAPGESRVENVSASAGVDSKE